MPATGLPRLVATASVPLGCVLCVLYCFKILINIDEETGEGIEKQ